MLHTQYVSEDITTIYALFYSFLPTAGISTILCVIIPPTQKERGKRKKNKPAYHYADLHMLITNNVMKRKSK